MDPGDPGLALPQPHLALPLLLPHLLVSLAVEAQLLQLVSPPQPGSHSEGGQEDQPHRQEDGPEALQVPPGMARIDIGVKLTTRDCGISKVFVDGNLQKSVRRCLKKLL